MKLISSLSKVGRHQKEISKTFNKKTFYVGPAVFDHPLYVLAFYNRSGSNLLGDYLRKTPYFSGFQEQLNFNLVANQSQRLGAQSFPDYIRAFTEEAGKGKFVHGFKASLDQIVMLERFGVPKMYTGGMRIIHITRADIVGQAISLLIANQTKKWTSRQQGLADDIEVNFDFKNLSNVIDGIQASTNGIAMFAKAFEYPLLSVEYENVVQEPEQVLKRVAEFAGQSGANWPVKKPSIERQATELNETFRQKFLEMVREKVI